MDGVTLSIMVEDTGRKGTVDGRTSRHKER